MPKQGERKGYARKRELGLVPYRYDQNSTRFKEGAWKNLGPGERETNMRALERSSRD